MMRQPTLSGFQRHLFSLIAICTLLEISRATQLSWLFDSSFGITHCMNTIQKQTSTKVQCATLCSQLTDCVGFFHHKDTSSCLHIDPTASTNYMYMVNNSLQWTSWKKNTGVKILIKHKSSGLFWHPDGGSTCPDDNTRVVVNAGTHSRMVWAFEQHENQWGYIRHVASGKYIHPYGGSLFPDDYTELIVHSTKHDANLFSLDAYLDVVLHKGGRYAHPYGGSAFPSNTTEVILHQGFHNNSTWQFVDPKNTTREVLVYGKPSL